MSKFSVKTLLIIFLSLLIAIVVLWKFVLPKQQIKAAWWNDSWNYRQAINISSHNSLESNVYIITSVNIGTTAKAQIDGGDFRFIDQSGQNLDYYIASGVGTTNLTFHILIPSFPSGAQTIYAYYGNSTIENGFSSSDFVTQATNYTIGSISPEESGGGPVAYWKFDEGIGTTVFDSSSNNNNGVLTGTTLPTWASEDQCISGKCLSFNGLSSTNNSQLTKDLNSIVSSNTNFTISTWINLKGAPNLYCGTIISAGDWNTTNSYWVFGIHYANGVYTGPQLGYGTSADMNYTFDLNKWYFLTWISDLGTNYFYVNGKYIGNSNNGNYSTTTIPKIGQANYGPYFNFNGLIDDLKIYPYSRTAAQIKLDYNSRGSSKGSSVNLGVKSNTAPSLKSKLAAYWKFDENNGSTVYDSSGNNLNGSFFGAGSSGPSWTNDAKNNKALSFGGDIQSIFVPNSSSIGFTNNFTISTWVYPREYPSGGVFKVLMGKVNTWTNGYALGSNNGNFQILVTNGIGYTIASDTSNYSLNKWYFLTATYNNSVLRFYVNGILKDQQTVPTIASSSNDFYIGGANGASNRGFNSIIDEVKIYNVALSDEEIKQDYNQGSATTFGTTNQTIGGTTTSLEYCIPGDTSYCASPVAEWNFEENTGTTVKDNSGNNLNGTFGTGNSAPTWTQGKIGSALSFDGNDFISTGNTTSYTSAFTVEGWFNQNQSSGSERGIITKYTSTFQNGSWTLETLSNGTNLLWDINDGAQKSCTTPISVGQWYHAVGVYTGSKGYLYLNGTLKCSFDVGTIATLSDEIRLGYAKSGLFTGTIDHIKIYNYARTPAQIAYDYNKGGPVGWWKLDECQGLTAFDASGLGNTGAINIGPSGSQTSVGTCQVGTSAAWTNGASGHTNSSLNFDGVDDYITTGSIGNTLTSMTVSIWIKTPTFNRIGTLISKWGTSKYSWMLFTNYWTADGHIDFLTSNNGTSYARAQTPSNTIIANKWQNIVGVYTGSSMYIYVDGILKATQNSSVPTSLKNVSTPLTIGADWDHSDTLYRTFNGQIDDVRIYNYALTSEQIKQIYNGGAINFN